MIKLSVDGKPAPQGSKTRGRYGQIYESSNAVGPWREAVRAEAQRVMADQSPLAGPVFFGARFRIARPRGHYGSGRNADVVRPSAPAWPTTKPDGDKLQRAVLDGLTGIAYRDDAQIVHYDVWLIYADRPGVDITLQEVD